MTLHNVLFSIVQLIPFFWTGEAGAGAGEDLEFIRKSQLPAQSSLCAWVLFAFQQVR